MHFKILTISIKNYLLPFLIFTFIVCLMAFPQTNLTAAREGLLLWANNLVPTLLPFLIATELLSKTNIVKIFGNYLSKFMRPLFNVPGEAGFAFLMGIISGYPVGAKIITNFIRQRICTKEEAERMLSFCNNSGPLFIIATVGSSFYYDARIGFLLLITHILSSISVGIILNIYSHISKKQNRSSDSSISTNQSINKVSDLSITECILSSIQTTFMIGGFILLFSVILSIMQKSGVLAFLSILIKPFFSFFNIPTDFIFYIISGIFEITTGLKGLSNILLKDMSLNIIFSAFILGFGGLCVLLQVYGIVSKENLSIKPYIVGKLLQGTLAAFYTFIFLENSCLFQFKIY